MTEPSDVSDLLARGGWEIVDPQTSQADLSALAPGSTVRAMFRVVTIADVVRDGLPPYDTDGRPVLVAEVERMWAIVTGVEGDAVDCVLTSHPFGTHTSLTAYDRLRIPLSHVIATGEPEPDYDEFLAFVARWESDPENPGIDPESPVDAGSKPRIRSDQQAVCDRAGARAEPPWPFGGGLLARNVTPESLLVYGARFVADSERRDTGWVVFADNDDFEEVRRTVGFTVATLQEIYEAHPAIWPYVALPTGWGFTLASGAAEVYAVDITD